MGKKTDKLIDDVEAQLKKIAELETKLEGLVKTNRLEELYKTQSTAQGKMLQDASKQVNALETAAKAAKLFRPQFASLKASAEQKLSALEKHVAEKKKARSLPWKSASVGKAEKYIKTTKDCLNGVDKRVEDFRASCKFRAEFAKTLSGIAVQLKKETASESD